MAKARKVVNDQNSAVVDHLVTTVNNLLLMIETASTSLTAGASAADVLNAWSAAVNTGTDNNPNSIANVSTTNLAIEGMWATPKMPRRRYLNLVTMTNTSNF